jgi:anaerobic ribonucleoside-triphosphate reductase activating protein
MRVSYEAITNTLGPGTRYAIWTQGCKRRCPGCINPEGWEMNGGYEISVDEVFKKIRKVTDLTGITISGGEPLLQLKEVWQLIKRIREETELDVMLYSGYRLEELKTKYGDEIFEFFKLTDIFVDGEYIRELNNNSQYRGSDNQHIYFFSTKYAKYAREIYTSKERKFSFEISDEGDVYFVGIPPTGFYEEFMKRIGG